MLAQALTDGSRLTTAPDEMRVKTHPSLVEALLSRARS